MKRSNTRLLTKRKYTAEFHPTIEKIINIRMKQAIFSLVLIATFVTALAQNKPAAKKPATAAKPAPVMKNQLDSFSYALGCSMAAFYKEQGIDNINTVLVMQALKDVKAGKTLLEESDVNNVIIGYMQAAKGKQAEPNKKLGQAFLDSNSKQSGVVTLPSGLQYKIIREGTGQQPGLNDRVKVHYHGTLINGKVFDSSIERGEPATFGVGEVIPGWTEALQLMPVGSKWKLFIPSDLAYGDNGQGEILPGSVLIFDVELLEIVK
jgi:FKBP-type peptidyl-prolyl cis-trans isomerase FklB